MIKKLRIKFIVLSMCASMAVLTVIMGTVNIINYSEITGQADMVLNLLAENNGKFPKMSMDKHMLSPEMPFETRFFSVILNEEGVVLAVDTGKIAAINTSDAIAYGEELFSHEEGSGFKDQYRYKIQATTAGTRIIFLDCTRSLDNFRSFLTTSIWISLFGLLTVLVIILFFSKRIIRPVSESYEKQKQFITNAGHEIKTPLTIINADSDVLAMELGENEWVSDIKRQSERLKVLTDELIYLSKMEEENTKLEILEFPLSDVVSETVQFFKAPAMTKNCIIEENIENMVTVKGDERAIEQLLSVVLDNAVKYSTEGMPVEVTLKRQGKNVKLDISNYTQGIAQENTEHLFDRFYRADSSRNSQTGGYGLGLSIAKAVVSAHKGRIGADLDEDNRLTVTIILPM